MTEKHVRQTHRQTHKQTAIQTRDTVCACQCLLIMSYLMIDKRSKKAIIPDYNQNFLPCAKADMYKISELVLWEMEKNIKVPS